MTFDPREFPEEPHVDDEPIPFDDSEDTKEPLISNAPLDLGGSNSISLESEPKTPTGPPTSSSGENIRNVKLFYTKLHAGSLDYLVQQINEWLSDNPNVTVKRTNMVVGDVIAKKTEPNLLITIWY